MDRVPVKRRLFYSGKIEPRRLTGAELCANGCIGPFTARPDMDTWLTNLLTEPVLPHYDCGTCLTTNGFTPEQLAGKAVA